MEDASGIRDAHHDIFTLLYTFFVALFHEVAQQDMPLHTSRQK
jgi:hypothetical protein